MQAINIQQDAICELHEAVVGYRPANARIGPAWKELREKRILCAGHPANHSFRVPGTQRTYMGRRFGNYNRIHFSLWDAHTGKATHPSFNLRRLIEDYDKEACSILNAVLKKMRQLAADEDAPTNQP